MKVLIIEDDQETVDVISLAFKMRWPEVELVSAKLGEEGLQLFEDESPQALILDLGLPDISGFEVLRRIRNVSNVPVVIMSVRRDEAIVVKAIEYGANEYITKPFRQLVLLDKLKELACGELSR
ncbi:MAG: response regulator [Dehalococcoidales bacterium]